MADLDPALLRSFVSVAESGSFTRAGSRVHRSQSTVSQQIRKLEDSVGHALFERHARAVALTAEGESLLGYARRILRLNDEARALFAAARPEPIRLGVPEDYAVEQLPALLARFGRDCPQARLEVGCELSVQLDAALDGGELDIALAKRLAPCGDALAQRAEALCWVAGADPVPAPDAALPLVLFPPGCIYRSHATAALDAAGRRWRVAYSSPNLAGVLAAVQAGLGLSVLSRAVLPAGVRRLGAAAGLPALPPSALVLRARPGLGPAAQALVALLRQDLALRQTRQTQR